MYRQCDFEYSVFIRLLPRNTCPKFRPKLIFNLRWHRLFPRTFFTATTIDLSTSNSRQWVSNTFLFQAAGTRESRSSRTAKTIFVGHKLPCRYLRTALCCATNAPFSDWGACIPSITFSGRFTLLAAVFIKGNIFWHEYSHHVFTLRRSPPTIEDLAVRKYVERSSHVTQGA